MASGRLDLLHERQTFLRGSERCFRSLRTPQLRQRPVHQADCRRGHRPLRILAPNAVPCSLRRSPQQHATAGWPLAEQQLHTAHSDPYERAAPQQMHHGSRRPARRRVSLRAMPSSGSTSTDAPPAAPDEQQQQCEARVRRLRVLVQLRRLYRNLIRGQCLLDHPSPVYSQTEAKEQIQGAAELDAEALAKEQIDRAVDIVAEMQLTSDQLKESVRKLNMLRGGFADAFKPGRPGKQDSKAAGSGSAGGDPSAFERTVRQRAIDAADTLRARARKEIGELPFTSRVVAQAALDARNARYRQRDPALRSMADDDAAARDASGGAAPSSEMEAWDRQRSAAIERLEAAEKVAGSVAKRLPGAVQKVRRLPPRDVLSGLQKSATYARNVWVRLNGGRVPGGDGAVRLPDGLPVPTSTKEQQAKRIAELTARVEGLEKRLQDASKARESRLRKAGLPARARMAAELRDMDTDILTLTRTLAVATLQLEMEFIHGSLEDEVLDIAPESLAKTPNGLLARSGTSDEVELLVVEFADFDAALAILADAVARGEAGLLNEDELDRLAVEIPDMRTRLGIRDDTVFAGGGLSLVKVQLQFQEGVAKVGEAAKFFSRGIRLLVSDVGNSSRLFMKAAFGGTLKPREVRGIRQTAKDVTVFIPFAVILIAPITPVGHVLVFGFLQRYFPGFFPSQFTSRRQAQMIKRQELQRQLAMAQEAAQEEVDEAEFAAASAAVSRLTEVFSPSRVLQPSMAGQPQPSNGSGGGSSSGGGGSGKWQASAAADDAEAAGPAAKRLRDLEARMAKAEADDFGSEDSAEEEDSGMPAAANPAQRPPL